VEQRFFGIYGVRVGHHTEKVASALAQVVDVGEDAMLLDQALTKNIFLCTQLLKSYAHRRIVEVCFGPDFGAWKGLGIELKLFQTQFQMPQINLSPQYLILDFCQV
jgi:hypothetical protein